MKEIKFKYVLKNKKNGNIVSDIFDLIGIENNDTDWIYEQFELKYGFAGSDPLFDDHVIIARLQYIELTDQNAKEIYESDLIKVSTNEKWIFKIVWDDYYSAFKGINIFDGSHDIIPGQYKTELIGNLFENPELMEKIDERS